MKQWRKATKEECKSIDWVLRDKIIDGKAQLQLKLAGNIKDCKNGFQKRASYQRKFRKKCVGEWEPSDRQWGENWNSQDLFSPSLFIGKLTPWLLQFGKEMATDRGEQQVRDYLESMDFLKSVGVVGSHLRVLVWWLWGCCLSFIKSHASQRSKIGYPHPAFVMDDFLSKGLH